MATLCRKLHAKVGENLVVHRTNRPRAIPRYTAKIAGCAARAHAGAGPSSARDRLAPLVIDPNHSERRAVALVVDPKRFQWPPVNHVTVAQDVARTQHGLDRQPLDQAEHASHKPSCRSRIHSDQIRDRTFESSAASGDQMIFKLRYASALAHARLRDPSRVPREASRAPESGRLPLPASGRLDHPGLQRCTGRQAAGAGRRADRCRSS